VAPSTGVSGRAAKADYIEKVRLVLQTFPEPLRFRNDTAPALVEAALELAWRQHGAQWKGASIEMSRAEEAGAATAAEFLVTANGIQMEVLSSRVLTRRV
jgi:hypothetical protein